MRYAGDYALIGDCHTVALEFDPGRGRMLGNYPQALTHLAHIEATLALADAGAHPPP